MPTRCNGGGGGLVTGGAPCSVEQLSRPAVDCQEPLCSLGLCSLGMERVKCGGAGAGGERRPGSQ